MFSKVLAEVDGSECARCAFDVAVVIARDSRAMLKILCAVQPPMATGQHKETAARFMSIFEREARGILANYAAEADKKGVKIEIVLSRGHPAKVILYTSTAENANLVVVWSRGSRRHERHAAWKHLRSGRAELQGTCQGSKVSVHLAYTSRIKA